MLFFFFFSPFCFFLFFPFFSHFFPTFFQFLFLFIQQSKPPNDHNQRLQPIATTTTTNSNSNINNQRAPQPPPPTPKCQPLRQREGYPRRHQTGKHSPRRVPQGPPVRLRDFSRRRERGGQPPRPSPQWPICQRCSAAGRRCSASGNLRVRVPTINVFFCNVFPRFFSTSGVSTFEFQLLSLNCWVSNFEFQLLIFNF